MENTKAKNVVLTVGVVLILIMALFSLISCSVEADVEELVEEPEATIELVAEPEEAEFTTEEIVEVVDETTGEAVTMTASEATASGKQVVTNSGSASSSQPSVSSNGSAPAASVHTHNWVPVTSQKWVVDQAATEYLQCQCGQTFTSQSAWSTHAQSSGFGSSGHAYKSVGSPEKGHYETITTGYTCACGATK